MEGKDGGMGEDEEESNGGCGGGVRWEVVVLRVSMVTHT